MVGKIAINTVVLFCFLLFACIANAAAHKTATGTVVYEDSSPAPGVVVYLLGGSRPLDITNNTIMIAEHLPRAITDAQGGFTLNKVPKGTVFLFARDMEDTCAFTSVFVENSSMGQIVIRKPAAVKGRSLKGDKPVKGQKVTVTYLEGERLLRYSQTAVTDHNGVFAFDSLIPGRYLLQVTHDVPQVGCCFRNVITKQLPLQLFGGRQEEIKLGGTDLPFLHGKITDADGKGLHGVWVKLGPKEKSELSVFAASGPSVVWSDVSERDGSYQIFDIPPGEYSMRCFRRLALNDYTRTLQATKDVVIYGPKEEGNTPPPRPENVFDVSINLEPFMPLAYGRPAPPISGTLLDGRQFDLSKHRGRIVVLNFYTSWCSACVSSASAFDDLADKFGPDKVVVLGINLDNDISNCRTFISEKKIRCPQLFAGPWPDSPLRKAYRVINVPTTFVIDSDGNVAQIDVFGSVLENFIEELLNRKVLSE